MSPLEFNYIQVYLFIYFIEFVQIYLLKKFKSTKQTKFISIQIYLYSNFCLLLNEHI